MRKNTAPFNWETRDEFAFREFESNLVSRVANIFEKEQGIYVLYGVRGTGKTSIKNYAQSIAEKSGFSNKNVFINIPSYYVKPKFVDFSGFSQIFSSYNRAIGDEQSLYLVLIS